LSAGLPRGDGEHVVLGDDVRLPAPSGHLEQVPLVPAAADVMDQMAQRDRGAEVRHLGHVWPDVVVPGDLPLVHEQLDGHRREVLRNRRDVEHRGRRDRDAVLEVGHAVPLLVDRRAVPHDGQGAPGRGGPDHVGEHRVDACLGCLGSCRRRREGEPEEQGKRACRARTERHWVSLWCPSGVRAVTAAGACNRRGCAGVGPHPGCARRTGPGTSPRPCACPPRRAGSRSRSP
jgi:hypothetical protein